MKHIRKYRAALIALVATAATACSNELPQPDETQSGNPAGRTITVTASHGADRPQTRLNYTEGTETEAKSMAVTWAEEDCFYLTSVTSSTDISSFTDTNASKFTIEEGEEGKNTASFTGPISEDWTSDEQLHAFYGKNSYIKIKDNVITYQYPSTPRQTANGNTDHISEYDFMHAIATYKTDEIPNINFEHVGALMKFEVTLPAEATDRKVTNLYLLTADGKADLTSEYTEDLSGKPSTPQTTNNLSLWLSTSGFSLAADEALTAYMMVAPMSNIAGKKLIVAVKTADGACYMAELTGAAILKGRFYTVTATLAPAFSGSGKAEDPYQIKDAGDLTKLSILMSAGAASAKNKHFEQKDNIELTGIDWIPFPFSDGTYDGKNFKITNLNCTTNADYAGFFTMISRSTIKNMNVEGSVTSTCTKSSSVGGIAGYSGNDLVITGCTFTGSVTSNAEGETADKSNLYMGGIIGEVYGNAQITECTNNGTVTNEKGRAKYIRIGGITGKQGGNINYYAYTRGCVNTGTITNEADISAASFCQIGGIIGESGTQSYILACYNTAEIKDEGGNNASLECGGIVGNLQATMTGCYNTGAVISTSTVSEMEIGGIVGSDNSGNINQCLWVKAADMTIELGIGSYTSGHNNQIPATADIATLNGTGVETLNKGIYDWNALATGGDNNPNSLKYCPFYFVAGSDNNTPPTLKVESPGVNGEDSNIVPWK